MGEAAANRDRRRIGQLCARLCEEGEPFAVAGPLRDLAMRIAGAVRDRQSPVEMSDDLDQLEDLLLRAGYTAGLSAFRSVVPDLPGLGGGHPQLIVFACPAQACLRVEPSDDVAPVCRVLGQPLRKVALGS